MGWFNRLSSSEVAPSWQLAPQRSAPLMEGLESRALLSGSAVEASLDGLSWTPALQASVAAPATAALPSGTYTGTGTLQSMAVPLTITITKWNTHTNVVRMQVSAMGMPATAAKGTIQGRNFQVELSYFGSPMTLQGLVNQKLTKIHGTVSASLTGSRQSGPFSLSR